MQRAQSDDSLRHAGLYPEPLTGRPREGIQPPVYSRTNAPLLGNFPMGRRMARRW